MSRGALSVTPSSRTPGIPSVAECRNDTCDVSTLPSSTWSQLDSTIHIPTFRWDGGTTHHSISGTSGIVSGGPRYAQIVSASSRTGYARTWIRSLKLLSAGSLGISTHAPDVSNFQP